MPVVQAGSTRVLYIHVPKTGGSYITALLRSYGPVSGVRFGRSFDGLPCSPQHFHRPLLEHLYSLDVRELRHDFDFVFMTVREPLARLRSEYRFRGGGQGFDAWAADVLRRYRDDPFVLDNHIRPQHEFVSFGAHVFKLEDGLEQAAQALDRATGMTGVRPAAAVNVSPAGDNPASAQTKQLVRDFYADDYAAFGY